MTMHSVDVKHNWQEVDRVDFRATSEIAIMRCADCWAERQVLHAKSGEKRHRDQESEEESKQALKGISESPNQFTETMNLYMNEMLDGTGYATTEALTDDIDRRYDGVIDGKNLPLRWLRPWAAKNYRKAQRKFLLLSRQGPVCNRCDRIFAFDELTEDHIGADRNHGQLTDLQLLCKECNGRKANHEKDERDVSPFKFEGETCIHRVPCTEIDAKSVFYDAEPRNAICSCFLTNSQSSRHCH